MVAPQAAGRLGSRALLGEPALDILKDVPALAGSFLQLQPVLLPLLLILGAFCYPHESDG